MNRYYNSNFYPSILLTGPIVVLLLLLLGAVLPLKSQPSQDLRVQLLAPVSTPAGKRILDPARSPRLHVLLQNTSPKTIRLWKDWTSWGYYNLTLHVSLPGEQILVATKAVPFNWDGDFPDFWTILPGESLVLEIDMRPGVWKGVSQLFGQEREASLSVFYENKPDALATEFGIWVGKAKSLPVEVILK